MTEPSASSAFSPLEPNPQQQQASSSSKKRKPEAIARSTTVVMSSYSEYHVAVLVLLSLAPLAIIGAMIATLLQPPQQPDETQELERQEWILVWSLIFVLSLYMLILPKQVDVRSDGSVGIKTALTTFVFGDIVRAYATEGTASYTFQQPKWKFATTVMCERIVIKRGRANKHQWDVIVSPVDRQGFLRALEETLRANENRHLEEGQQQQPALVDNEPVPFS